MAENTQYETVIGLEVHIQLGTESKAFCSDDARFGGAPNTHIGWISLGLPGTLPRLNMKVTEYALRLGKALNCRVNQRSIYDRKNYFYADLPKGFQTTQDAKPICEGGYLDIQGKRFDLHHIHMEEDAGKSIHDQDPAYTLIDLNRAGVPLLEMVTLPVFSNGDEVSQFMEEMRRLVRWLGISDGNMEEGSLRCDVNISVRKAGSTEFGTRCEVKNMNSMRFARKAIAYEAERQINILESGRTVTQETRGFDPGKGITFSLREKEDAHDYRYFPEPDLPPVLITDTMLDQINDDMPELPWSVQARFANEIGLNAADAALLTQEYATAAYADGLFSTTRDNQMAKKAGTYLVNRILPWITEKSVTLDQYPLSKEQIIELITLVESGKINATVGYQQLLPNFLEQPYKNLVLLAEELNLFGAQNTDDLETIVDEILAKYPDKVKEYRQGKKGLIGMFMGELMKATKGKIDPPTATRLLEQKLRL